MSTAVRSVVVAGGAGAVGSMLTGQWSASGAAVLALDTSADAGHDIRCPNEWAADVVAAADVVVLAVPEVVALTAVGVVGPLLRPGAVLVETLSVKSRFADAVAAADIDPGASVVGVNPMFAPSLGLPGRAVAVVIHRGGPAADVVVSDLAGWGARIQETTADQHDRWCAAMQALTHAAVLSFGLALEDLGVGVDETAGLSPPPHTVATALLARIALGTPEVYRDVQVANPYARQAREALVRGMSRLSAVCEDGVESDFADLLADAGVPLGDLAATRAALCARVFDGLGR